VLHWKEGGHDQLCKEIKKGGGAERYHADTRYKEAVTDAADACADDTKGQTCYICTEAVHWKTKEGLVRGCACRGTSGFAHVSCLTEQAKILFAEAEENNLDSTVLDERWVRWYSCSLCKQYYHGEVRCALGWACWKTYCGRPEADEIRGMAISQLGIGLALGGHHEDALSVKEAELSLLLRLGASEDNILVTQSNLASTYQNLGRTEAAMRIKKEVYAGRLKLSGKEHENTLISANNYASSLRDLERFEEAKALIRKTMPVARRILGESNELTLRMKWNYAEALYMDDDTTLDGLREAVTTLEEAERIARRVFGGANPLTTKVESDLLVSRAALRAREESPGGAA